MYEKFGFEADPYAQIEPFLIPMERLEWNRDDLQKAKGKFDDFIADIKNLNKVGLAVWGPWGSGKTWLLRLIQKFVGDDDLVIYTKISRIEPTFSAFYSLFIENLMPKIDVILQKIDENSGPKINDWVDFIKDEDLAHCLYHLYHHDEFFSVSKKWLFGEKAPSKGLGDANLITTLDGDLKKYRVLEKLLDLSRLAFQTPILIIDELENATGKIAFAMQLSDVMRNLLDRFYERFALVCAYTAEMEDEWYDLGYGEAVQTRLDYKIELMSLEKGYICRFLRKHHALYRKEEIDVTDQLSPFTEDGIQRMVEVMDPAQHYPRQILHNCRNLVREAVKSNVEEIDKEFVNNHLNNLDYLTTGLGLYE